MKRRALLQGLTAAALVATPAMRAAALVRDFGAPSYKVGVWTLMYDVCVQGPAEGEYTAQLCVGAAARNIKRAATGPLGCLDPDVPGQWKATFIKQASPWTRDEPYD